MRIIVLLAALLSADPAVNVRLVAIETAGQGFKAEQARLAEASDDAERLRRIFKIDQDSTRFYPELDGLNDEQVKRVDAARTRMFKEINAANVAEIDRMLPAAGWFSNKVYGQEAATGAYLVIQHTDTPAIQRPYLPAIEKLVASKEALASEYALLYDRIAVHEGRLQRYGTQMHCVDGRMAPQPMEDPAKLEERRAPMGFRWPTYQDYLANFGACPRQMMVGK